MDIRDSIEEKYTNYLNRETDYLDLTIEEGKFILSNDKKEHFVDDLLSSAYVTVLNELEKKDKVINEMANQLIGLSIYDANKEIIIFKNEEEVKEYFTNKAENVGE